MSAEVYEFPHRTPPITPLAQFVRLGESSYRRHASLFAEGHLDAKRIVVDASVIRFLKSELRHFRDAGVEIVLDTKAAELAARAKFGGLVKNAPWSASSPEEPLGAAFFRAGHPSDIFGQIARLAVEHEVNAVLAPGHFLGDPEFGEWLEVDRYACIQLRHALDREGGRAIAIDYLLIVPHLKLNEPDFRLKIVETLADLPFDNLWVRASGFGNDAGAQPIVQFITSISQLHNLGKPIIADYLGGLVGEAVMALGAASGVAHGIGESERFDARQLHNPPKERDPERSGGRGRRVSVGAINRSFLMKEFETLLTARGAKRLLMPQLAGAGLKTAADVVHEPKIVASRQAVAYFGELNSLPNIHRATHFMSRRMEPAVELARQVKNLEPNPEVAKAKNVNLEKLMERMSNHSRSLAQKSNALAVLKDQLQDQGISVRPIQRLSRSEENARGGRL